MNLFTAVFVLTVVFACVYCQCTVPKCSCKYGTDPVEVEEPVVSTEVLAGTVGALSSVVVSGGGIGIWYLIKSRSPGGSDGDSIMSDDSGNEPVKKTKAPPPPYGNRTKMEEETSFKPPNIYTAGMNDDINHRVSGKPRNMMTLNDI